MVSELTAFCARSIETLVEMREAAPVIRQANRYQVSLGHLLQNPRLQ